MSSPQVQAIHKTLAASSDEEVVALGLRAIYDRYAPYVAKVALHVLGHPNDVEDIIQEVFLEVHHSLDSLQNPSAIKGWLATITVRKIHRRLRKKRIPLLRLFDPKHQEPTAQVPARGISPEDWVMLQHVLKILERRVKPKARIAWALKHVSGFSMEEVAQHCECSVRTAHRHIRQAEACLEQEVNRG